MKIINKLILQSPPVVILSSLLDKIWAAHLLSVTKAYDKAYSYLEGMLNRTCMKKIFQI